MAELVIGLGDVKLKCEWDSNLIIHPSTHTLISKLINSRNF